MFKPHFRVSRTGVPILSKQEINDAAEAFVWDYQSSALRQPEPLDIEGFMELYLGMIPDFQYLSHNGIYLGMTIFNDTDKVPVYDPLNNRAEYIHADANTVIIDRRLIEDTTSPVKRRCTGCLISPSSKATKSIVTCQARPSWTSLTSSTDRFQRAYPPAYYFTQSVRILANT